MTYNVLSGMLSLYTATTHWSLRQSVVTVQPAVSSIEIGCRLFLQTFTKSYRDIEIFTNFSIFSPKIVVHLL